MAEQEEGIVLSWGQGGGGSADDPLVISNNEDLEGEDSEVITAFSGTCKYTYMYVLAIVQCHVFVCMKVQKARLLQPIPKTRGTIPVPPIYNLANGQATEVPCLENLGVVG